MREKDMFGNEVVVEEEPKKNGKKKGEEEAKEKKEKKDDRPAIVRFANSLGLDDFDYDAIKEVEKEIKVKIAGNQEISLYAFKGMIVKKMYEYVTMRVHKEVEKKMRDQGDFSEDALRFTLMQLAEKEIKYGLQPMVHVIPLKGNLYVNISGYRFYARNTGIKYGVSFECLKDGSTDNKWRYRCTISFADGSPSISAEGYASPQSYKGNIEYIANMAMKRAEMHAYSRAFPIGASVEEADMIPYDEGVNYSAQPIGDVIAGSIEELLGGPQSEVVINSQIPDEVSETVLEETE